MATSKTKTTKLPKLTNTKVGTQAQRDAINKTIATINKGLAGGITGVKDSSGKTIKEKVYFTDKGAQGGSSGKMYTNPPTNAITPEKLVTAPTPALPPVPQVNNVGDVVTPGNVGLASSIQGATIKDGQFVLPQLSEPTSSSDTTGLQQNMQSYLSNLLGNKPVDNEALYKKTEKEVGLNKAQQEVNNYTSQLNAITASSQAQQLALEGQGRGQTSGFIGGEQARINREAAIAALPVQAQLATAQGNLEFAQQRLDTLFKIRSADAQAKYDFTNKIFSTYYDFANTIQKSKMDALKVKEDRAYAEKQQSIADAKNIAMQAIEYGQSSLASRIMGLDHDSPTYVQDVASAWEQLRKPASATKLDTAFDKDGNLINMQTGEVLRSAGGGVVDAQKQQQINETLGLARELLGNGGFWDETGKSSAIGASLAKFVPFGQSLGLQGDRTSFENKVNTLKANLTLDNLSLLKGPMSDKDLAFLQAIGSSISTNMSEKEFDTQVKKIVKKLEEKSAVMTPSGTKVITAPDGTEIEIID